MSKELNKQLLFNNVEYLREKKNLNIKTLEEKAGVSTGYISRVKDKANLKLGAEFLVNLADVLETSVDMLVKVDIAALTPTEHYLIDFIKKLAQDTREDKLYWKRESQYELTFETLPQHSSIESDWFENHPLFSIEEYDEGERDKADPFSGKKYRPIFLSNAYGHQTEINGDCFKLAMTNGATLYLMNICKAGSKANEAGVFAKELWILKESGKSQYLCGTRGDATFLQLQDLYTVVKENSEHPKVTPDIRNIIENFMHDIIEDQNEEAGNVLKLSDDEIPF